MNILILGGTGDARQLAQYLINAGYDISYSIAGIVRKIELDCRVLSGGFSQYGGLYQYLYQQSYDLLIDASHPYAERISRNAVSAAQRAAIPLWRLDRPVWQASAQDQWTTVTPLTQILAQIAEFKCPFFTLGREVLSVLDSRPPEQHWLIRTAIADNQHQDGVTILRDIGPYQLDNELALFQRYGVDVLISKNSGGEAVAAKLFAARQLGLPVYLLARPVLPRVENCFDSWQALYQAILRQ